MLEIVADTHTHTLACDHAFSTIAENVAQAKKRGLRFLCMTEHAPSLPGAPSKLYFGGQSQLPRVIDDVMIIKGVELNIMDHEGTVDLPEHVIKKMDWVIASHHTPCIDPATPLEHTKSWMSIAHNPLVHVIGHCGDGRYGFDYKTVIREFGACGKIVEINNHSFSARAGSKENCRTVALLCAEYGVPVVLSSDAHSAYAVGELSHSIALMEEIGFPEEQILNADYDRFLEAVRRTSGKPLTDGK